VKAQLRRKLRGEGKRAAKHQEVKHAARSCARFLRGSLLVSPLFLGA